MKLGPKLATCFVLLTVLPVGFALFVFLRTATELGDNITVQAQESFSNRLTEDLQRATDLNALAFDSVRDDLLRDAVNAAAEVASQFNGPPPDVPTNGIRTFKGGDNGEGPLDLKVGDIRVEDGANLDAVSGALARLKGLSDVGRTMYLRHRDVLRGTAVALELGVTARYPAGSYIEAFDLRETTWYTHTLESLSPGWAASNPEDFSRWLAIAPIIRDNGILEGALRFDVPLKRLLRRAIGSAQIPNDATSQLIVVPRGHPNLYPHRIAHFDLTSGDWVVDDRPEPLNFEGDDTWLKVVSDMRSGVPGLEVAVRGDRPEVWSFTPLGPFVNGDLHLATVLPKSTIDDAQRTAHELIDAAFRGNLQIAAVFAIVAGTLAALLGLGAARTLTRPIRRLHDASKRLSAGDFSVRVDAKGSDEIGDLSRDFNDLVPALEEQVRVSKDLGIAHEVQQNLLPNAAPTLSGFDIAGRAAYCNETGGDYLDYIDVGGGQLGIVLGDVSGHGVGAALLMASARATLRAHARRDDNPSDVIAALNRDLETDASGGRFMTMFFVTLQPDSADMEWISAGHEPAILYDPSTDTFSELTGDGIPLAVDQDWQYAATTTDMAPGSILVLFTDGIREAPNGKGERYEMGRLRDAIRETKGRGADAIATRIMDDVVAFRGDAPMRDDMSVVVIRKNER